MPVIPSRQKMSEVQAVGLQMFSFMLDNHVEWFMKCKGSNVPSSCSAPIA